MLSPVDLDYFFLSFILIFTAKEDISLKIFKETKKKKVRQRQFSYRVNRQSFLFVLDFQNCPWI